MANRDNPADILLHGTDEAAGEIVPNATLPLGALKTAVDRHFDQPGPCPAHLQCTPYIHQSAH